MHRRQEYNLRIDSLLRTYYNDVQPGAAVTHQCRHNKTIFKKAYGLANYRQGKKQACITNFNIGSLTKQFTAFCIVELAEQKKLSLDDKIIKYFPGFNQRIGNLSASVNCFRTVRALSTIIRLQIPVHIKHATDKDVLNAVQHIDSTYFTPGTRYRYSNTAYCLLALIIEKASGKSYCRLC